MNSSSDSRVLAIDPTTKGFGFAVLEEPDRLVDWGIKAVAPRGNKQVQCLRRVRALIVIYQPSMIVVEDCSVRSCRRCPRVRRLIDRIRRLAQGASVRGRLVARAQVRRVFAPAATKHKIATAIAARFRELAPILPPPRTAARPTEDARMHVFWAAALGLTFLGRERGAAHETPLPLDNDTVVS